MNAEMNQIIIIDDDVDYRNLLSRKLHRFFPDKSFYEFDPKKNSLPEQNYNWDSIELIILDFDFGLNYTGLDWFKIFIPEEMPATILMTAHGSEEIAIKAIKMGIDDYIVKGHFNDDELKQAIIACISSKKEKREKLFKLKNKTTVFEKSAFLNKLQLITDKKDIKNNLILINPVACQLIGENSGIQYQDSYIKYVTDHVFDYLNQNNISMNIFIYREEYIAIIFKTDNCEKNVNDICESLENEKFTIGLKKYPCSVNVGVISPRHFEESEFNKNDYELLSTALFLCKSAKNDDEKNVYHYGDINVKEVETDDGSQQVIKLRQEFDIERAIEDGRISANYQPWVYILSDDKANIKDIYDVRVEFVDTRGNKILQQKLYKILDNIFSKRIVDRWVLKHSVILLTDLANKYNGELNLKLTVKITLSSIVDQEFVAWAKELLINSKLPRGCLYFEIEAQQFQRDTEPCIKFIEEFSHDFDIKFILSAIPRVDIYYQIRELHTFDYVKLNIKNLTIGVPREPVKQLIGKIKKDGAKIVAVNIADAETLAFATEFEVDYVHGYLVGKPYIDVISDSDGDLYCVI